MKLKNPFYMTSGYWSTTKECASFTIREGVAHVGTHHNTSITFHVDQTECGLLIAPEGVLHINSSGDRDRDRRADYDHMFGVKCALASELSGQLVCPHTGCDVVASRVADNPVLWLDFEHGVAIKAGSIEYTSPEAAPQRKASANLSNFNMHYSFSNQKRYKQMLLTVQQLCNEAALRLSLDGMPTTQAVTTVDAIKLIAAHPDIVDIESLAARTSVYTTNRPDLPTELAKILAVCKTMSYITPTLSIWRDRIKLAAADHYTTDKFLIKKEAA